MGDPAINRPFSILVIDDEPELVLYLARAFESIRGKVTTAVDGIDALKKLESCVPLDLVLLDLSLPQMSGLEFLEKLQGVSPGTNVIISTGYTANFTPDETEKFKIAAVLSKPYGMDELISVTAQALG